MTCLYALFWEFVQNTPVIVLFVASVWWWTRNHFHKALIGSAIGALSSSLIIYFTEPLITGRSETIQGLIVNLLLFGGLQVPFTVYLSSETRWSNWKTDLLLGTLAGIGLALMQSMATSNISTLGLLVHSAVFLIAGGVIITSIRPLKTRLLSQAVGGALVIVTAMTLTIGGPEYCLPRPATANDQTPLPQSALPHHAPWTGNPPALAADQACPASLDLPGHSSTYPLPHDHHPSQGLAACLTSVDPSTHLSPGGLSYGP